MELWMLLLHLHLVVCVSLPEPSNVFISSFNMEHTLSFLPGHETPSDTHFTVQILCPRYSVDGHHKAWREERKERKKRNMWKPVAACSELTAGQTCNLTQTFKDPFDHYRARVQAFTSTQTSGWTESGWFQPLSDTVLGLPDVSVSGCGNCLVLQLRVPSVKRFQQLRDLYRGLILDVQRTWDGAQFRLNLPYKEEHMIAYLQPGVEYCVNISVTSLFNNSPVSSKPYCAFTSPPPSRSSLYVVFSLLGAFCVLGFLLIGLVLHGGQLSIESLRQHLARTLVTNPTVCTGTLSFSCSSPP